MTQLCVPVTDIFRRNQLELLPLVGAVSFKQPTDETFEGKEQMLECSLNIASPSFKEDLAEHGLLRALQSGKYTSFACDLGPAWEAVDTDASPNGYPRYIPASGPMTEQAYLRQAGESVEFLRSHFYGVIKVEQLNFFPTGAYELVCDPDFIARVLRHLQIELMLDIGHLIVSVHNLGIPMEEYLDALPLESVSEIQLSGSNIVNGIWEDTHEVPSESDLATLESVLARTNARYVTLEYYKKDRPLVMACQRLYNVLTDYKNNGSKGSDESRLSH